MTAVLERRATRTIADLPGPRGLPGAGNALQLPNTRLHLALERWARRHGPVFRFTIGSRPIVAFAEPDAINAILRERPDGYRRWREAEDVFRELGIHGVFSAEGDEWRKQRRLAVMALNTNHLHRYFDVIRVSTERLRGRLERAAHTGEPFELQRAFMSFTTDVASSLAFGHDLNTLEHESELQSHIERVFPMLSRRIAAPFPYWRYVKPPADRAAERSLVEIRAAVDGFIAQARERMAASAGALGAAGELPREHARRPARGALQRRGGVRQHVPDPARRRGHDRALADVDGVVHRPRPVAAAAPRRGRARDRETPTPPSSTATPCCARRCG